MPKYDVQVARDVRKYYHITIDAPSEGYATAKAEEIWWKTSELEFRYEEGEDELLTWEVFDVIEIQNSGE